MPACTIRSSSRRFWPCSVMPESVPIATLTPAAMAFATAVPMDVGDLAGLAQARRRDLDARRGGVEDALRGEQGRDEPGAALEHQLDRLVVEEDPVFDAPDAGPDGGLDPRRALRVGHDRDAGRVGLLDQHVQLGGAEVAVARIVARRHDPARRADLDLVGAGPDELADLPAHLVGPVHDARGMARPVGRRAVVAGRQPAVGVAAGLGQDADGDVQPRTGDQPFGDGRLEAEVRVAGVTDGGDADVERPAQVRDRAVEPVRERRLHLAVGVEPGRADHDVRMAVEQAGQDGAPAQVDRLVAIEARVRCRRSGRPRPRYRPRRGSRCHRRPDRH